MTDRRTFPGVSGALSAGWYPEQWRGAISESPRLGGVSPRLTPLRVENLGKLPVFLWHRYALPSTNQHGPSCVTESACNILEMLIRRFVAAPIRQRLFGMQLDGYPAWEYARMKWHKGDMTGGLTFAEGFRALKDLGYVPPGFRVRAISHEPEAVIEALAHCPCWEGHLIHPGWQTWDPVNGCIDHGPMPTDRTLGHAVVRLCPTFQDDRLFWVLQNSWGPRYAYHGFFLMSDDEWREGFLGDGPYIFEWDEEFVRFDGWRRWLRPAAQETRLHWEAGK